MKVFNKINDIKEYLANKKQYNNKIGFVPTMGALHKGHISLIERCKTENNITIASIFVNPIQFNNSNDFKNYPRTIEKDISILHKCDCDAVFIPSAEEMYPKPDNRIFDFGQLDKVMEGKYRPGHFNGVAIVVSKLFDIINPDNAYFGEKDYQQLLIIKKLTKQLQLPINIIGCTTVREADGLAMSSRNTLLSPEQRKTATIIPQTLLSIQTKINAEKYDINNIKKWVTETITNANKQLEVEYFEIANNDTLEPINEFCPNQTARAFIAVKIGNVRLIDNIEINLKIN